MNIDFVKASPSKNMTVLVTNYVAPADYSAIAHTIMNYEYVNAEQVGFIEAPTHDDTVLRLAMSGGELCGNAVLTAAAYCRYKGLTDKTRFSIETTGVEAPLDCLIEAKSSHLFEVKAEMPEFNSSEAIEVTLDNEKISGTVIHMDGISHLLTEHWLDKESYVPLMNELAKKIDNKAVGIIPYKNLEENNYETKPFVHVKETGSSFFEQACGSGSLALGLYLSNQKTDKIFNICQPGGIIVVGTGVQNYISTTVRFTLEGSCEIDLSSII